MDNQFSRQFESIIELAQAHERQQPFDDDVHAGSRGAVALNEIEEQGKVPRLAVRKQVNALQRVVDPAGGCDGLVRGKNIVATENLGPIFQQELYWTFRRVLQNGAVDNDFLAFSYVNR